MSKISIRVLGANTEVGRSAIMIQAGDRRILMDYGLKLVPKKEPLYPEEVDDVDAVILSHAHVDHSGAIPTLFRKRDDVPIYGVDITGDLMELLLYDSIKVAKRRGYHLRYGPKEVRKALENYRSIEYRVPFRIGNVRVTAYNAGHIPGSAMFRLEFDGFSILYTGDFNLRRSRLVPPADVNMPKVDLLITESTYAFREHPPREGQERLLKRIVLETMKRGGLSVIAGFAIGRLAEISLVLSDLNMKFFLDGMAKKSARITEEYRDRVRNFREFRRAMEATVFVKNWKVRRKIVNKPSVVLTTSGMLEGGPVHFYLKEKHEDERSSITLTGYQIEGTEGRKLLETGEMTIDEENVEVNMRVSQLNFSAHASRSNLLELIKLVSPDMVVPVHGEETERFAKEIKETFDIASVSLEDPYEEIRI